MSGVELIAEERERQRAAFSADHDAAYPPGEIAMAAAGFLLMYVVVRAPLVPHLVTRIRDTAAMIFPWRADKLRKHAEPARMLTIAGALIAAQLDRDLAAVAGEERTDDRGQRTDGRGSGG